VPDTDETLAWRGRELHDGEGQRIGVIEEIYLDAETGAPRWALVQTGMFGTTRTFVPLQGASESEDAVAIPLDRDAVKDAPSIDPDGQLSRIEEDALRAHYEIGAQ
jgi:sporulation protein YlmC with PRC-barrel domain